MTYKVTHPVGTELVLQISRNEHAPLLITGVLNEFFIEARVNELTRLSVVISEARSEIAVGQSRTEIIDFGVGAVRVGGVVEFSLSAERCTVLFNVYSFHSSYEDAAAVIMREKLEKE